MLLNRKYNSISENRHCNIYPCSSVRNIKGGGKCGIFTFDLSQEAVEEALKLDRTVIRGRPMFISRCDPNKSTRSSGFKYRSTIEKNKLFVKGMKCLRDTNEILLKTDGLAKRFA